MNGLVAFLSHHLAATGFGSGALIVAIISTMPQIRPKTLDDWWEWVRNSLQTAIPASRRQQETTIQAPPVKISEASETPTQPKENQ